MSNLNYLQVSLKFLRRFANLFSSLTKPDLLPVLTKISFYFLSIYEFIGNKYACTGHLARRRVLIARSKNIDTKA